VRQILDADRQLQLLADQAKARRLIDDEPSVTFIGLSGEQDMQRRADRLFQSVRVTAGHVVNLAVSDHDDTGEALARHLRHRPIQCMEQSGPIVAGTGLRLPRPDHTQVEITFAGEPIPERGQRHLGRALAIADALARRFVDDDDCDVALR